LALVSSYSAVTFVEQNGQNNAAFEFFMRSAIEQWLDSILSNPLKELVDAT
jgi:hypothetical protein